MRRFKAFTLTELMIALAVIGVLVAVVTPAIMRTRPNKNKMMIKKSYYEAEKIVSSLINDETLYIDGRDACNSQAEASARGDCNWGFDDYNSVVYDGETYANGTKFPGLFGAKLNFRTSDTTNWIYTTSDGVIWYLSGTANQWGHTNTSKPSNITNGSIIIDVNGADGPNCRQNGRNQVNATCTGSAADFDQYKIDISVTGKMTIDADITNSRAADFVTINTSLRDSI